MARILKLLVLVPIAIVILAFAVANRTVVSVSFDPFSANDPGAIIMAPLFVVLFLTLIVGVIVGGTAAWFAQGSNRRKARHARQEAEQWQDEARRLREQSATVSPSRVLIR